MICLTGDVHHAALGCNDQRYIADPDLTEVRIAGHYVALLEQYGVKATLYVCGRCFQDEWADLRYAARHPLVEIAGHMYRARRPRPLFDRYGKRTGLWNGPRWYQDWDIRRNIEVATARTGKPILAWRAHSYMVDGNTYELLAAHGVRLASDTVEADALWPRRLSQGILSHPINVIPDHDHLYHAHRTPEYVERINREGYGADTFGAVSYPIGEWGRLAIEQAKAIDDRGGVVTILAHPICMYLADEFRTFEMLLAFIAKRRNVWTREILDVEPAPPPGLAGPSAPAPGA